MAKHCFDGKWTLIILNCAVLALELSRRKMEYAEVTKNRKNEIESFRLFIILSFVYRLFSIQNQLSLHLNLLAG